MSDYSDLRQKYIDALVKNSVDDIIQMAIENRRDEIAEWLANLFGFEAMHLVELQEQAEGLGISVDVD